MNENPFEVKKQKSKKVRKPRTKKQKIILAMILLISPIVLYIGGIIIILVLSIPYTKYHVEKVESSYDYQQYIADNNYPQDTKIIARNEDSQLIDINSSFETYEYVAGVDFEPGLYTVDMLALSDEEIAPTVRFRRSWQREEDAYWFPKAFEEDRQFYYNVLFEEGDAINIQMNYSIPAALFLVPQDEYVQFSLDPLKFGFFKEGQSIDKGTYDIGEQNVGYVCSEQDMNQTTVFECDKLEKTDYVATIDEGDTLLMMNTFDYSRNLE